MGCGESKHAVATADTISQQNSRSNSMKSKRGETKASIDKPTNDVKTGENIVLKLEKNGNGIVNTGNIGNKKDKECENIDANDFAIQNVKEGDQNVGKDSKGDNGKEGENLKADNATKADQPNGESAVENIKESEKKEAAVEAPVEESEKKEAVEALVKESENKEFIEAPVKESEKKEAFEALVKESENKEFIEAPVKVSEEKEAVEAAVFLDDMKNGSEKKESKEETIEESKTEEGGDKEQEEERLQGPNSPNHYLSPKKDEQTIEFVISENKDASEHKTDVNDIVEERESTPEMKTEANIDAGLNENEVNQIGEGEAEVPLEGKDSTNNKEGKSQSDNEEEKIPSAKGENANESSPEV